MIAASCSRRSSRRARDSALVPKQMVEVLQGVVSRGRAGARGLARPWGTRRIQFLAA